MGLFELLKYYVGIVIALVAIPLYVACVVLTKIPFEYVKEREKR